MSNKILSFRSNKAKKSYDNLVKISQNFNLDLISEFVLNNNLFNECSGSSRPTQHHYGTNGLLIHTAEVVQSCLIMADYYNEIYSFEIDKKELFLSKNFHFAFIMT